jgi:hypothetical protein
VIRRYSPTTAFYGWSDEATSILSDELKWLHDHAFASEGGQLSPPVNSFFLTRLVAHINNLIWRCKKKLRLGSAKDKATQLTDGPFIPTLRGGG